MPGAQTWPQLFVPLPVPAHGGAAVLTVRRTPPGRAGVVRGPRKERLFYHPLFKGGEISCLEPIKRGDPLPAGVWCPSGWGSERLRELTPGKLRVRSAPLSPLASDSGSSLAFEIHIHLSLSPTLPLSLSLLFIRVLSALCTFTFHLIISDWIVASNKGEKTIPQPLPAPLEGLSSKPLVSGTSPEAQSGGGVGGCFFPSPLQMLITV